MKRVFIGIRIGEDRNLKKLVSSVKEELRDDIIKWTDPGNLHITLAFLGNTPEEKIIQAGRILEYRCSGYGSFEIILNGLGVFKNYREPKILWVGMDQSEKLNALRSLITGDLGSAGVVFDDKPFSPHLTIGRIKRMEHSDRLKILLLKHHSTEIMRFYVKNVILFESVPGKDGPVYTPLLTCSL